MAELVTGKVWNGSVHIRIRYKDTEFLLDAKRVLYFPSYFQRIVEFFHVATNSDTLRTQPVWLEYEDVPIKWNLPIGLLHDLLYLLGNAHDTQKQAWTLSLRVSSESSPYPADHIIPFDSGGNGAVSYESLLNQILVNSLKQSCYVMNGNSRSVLNLSHDDTRALFHAMANHDLTVYTSISRKLVLPSKDAKQRIPIKIYSVGSASLFQFPVWSKDEQGNDNSLRRAICEQLPDLSDPFPEVYIHGINVDVLLNEPILDLWTHFRYMDNFLYIVLAIKN